MKNWLEKRDFKSRNQMAIELLANKYGSVHKGLEVILDTPLARTTKEAKELGIRYCLIYKQAEPLNFSLHDSERNLWQKGRGQVLNAISLFKGFEESDSFFKACGVIEKHFEIPIWLLLFEKRELALEWLLNKFGSKLSAAESLTGLKFYTDPKKTGEDWNSTNGYRLTSENGEFSVVHLIDGGCAAPINFFENLGACLGYRGKQADEAGWDLVYNYILDSDTAINFVVDEEAKAKRIAEQKRQEKEAEDKKEEARERAFEILSRAESGVEAKSIYASYLSNDRSLPAVDPSELSDNILMVRDLEYFNKRDAKNHKRKFMAIILPLVKQESIHALHVIYLENTEKGWVKARVETPKKDLQAWSIENGSSCTIASSQGSKVCYIGEGNENVTGYYAALRNRLGHKPNADFKCTNTAGRLSAYDHSKDDYHKYVILVDRDRSGTGMKHSMLKRAELLSQGFNVEMIIPPSVTLPIFIYPDEKVEALSLQNCFDEAEYWNALDEAFKNDAHESGKQYKSRYNSLVVIENEEEWNSLDDQQKNMSIIKSEITKDKFRKDVDWVHLLPINEGFALEIQDFYERVLS